MSTCAQLSVSGNFFNPRANPTTSEVREGRFEQIWREQQPSRILESVRKIARVVQQIAITALVGLGFLVAGATALGAVVGVLLAVDLVFTSVGLPICGMIATGLLTAFIVLKLLGNGR